MKLPQTIFVRQAPADYPADLEAHRKLTNFEGLRDVEIGEYRLVENGGTKLTINEKVEKAK
jgi:hypothetical protein